MSNAEISIEEFKKSIPAAEVSPKTTSRLKIASTPQPYVPPRVHVVDGQAASPVSAEIVFVRASAAVGKSVTARYLSAMCRAPLLDLATVPVSTHSLIGLIQSDFDASSEAIRLFHDGRMPIIIDALDEGRLLSGEQAFEGFVETTGELLLSERKTRDKPKLIFFGRHESTALSQLAFQLQGTDISLCTVQLDFFDKDSAKDLINAYAAQTSGRQANSLDQEPVRELVETYFEAIESALGLNPGQLWEDERGRAFAGYAPVLAALGSLLSEITNPLHVTNRLRESGGREAWGVIETVLQEVLVREQGKLCSKLQQQVSGDIPEETYDSYEQLSYLCAYIHEEDVMPTGRVRLSASDHATYMSMVEQYLPEHPFIRGRDVANHVLGSSIIGHGILCDSIDSENSRWLQHLSRQPFIWRSISQELSFDNTILDGHFLGYILNSFWNDPAASSHEVSVWSKVDGTVSVEAGGSHGERVGFVVMPPISLFGQIHDIDLRVEADVKIIGEKPGIEKASGFYVYGNNVVIAESLQTDSDVVTIEGSIWLEADSVVSEPRLRIHPKKNAKVGWGGNVGKRPPWNRVPSSMNQPYRVPSGYLAESLVKQCKSRLSGGSSLILCEDYSIPQEDAASHLRWAYRDYGKAFSDFIEALVSHDLAQEEPIASSGSEKKIRIRFRVEWADLERAFGTPE